MTDAAPPHLDGAVRGLAANPALPAALVRRLFHYRKGFGDVARRPDLTADMIVEVIATGDHWLTHSLALNRELPQDFRMRLAEHPDPAIRAAVVTGAGEAPRALFEPLIDDPDPRVRERLAQHDGVPADLRARLATDPDPQIRAALAQWWPGAPEPVRRILLTDPEDAVRAGACATYYRRLPHPVPPADLLPGLLADPVTRAGAVRHCALEADTARRLADDPDAEVRRATAAHADLPAALRDGLADDPRPLVALGVFARRDTPEPVRAAIHARLSSDEAAGDWAAVFDAVEDGTLDDDAFERRAEAALARLELRSLRLPWVTADPLPHLDSPYVCFRASAAMAEGLSASAVARLLDDAESGVRIAAALHARDRVDPATAERLDRGHRPHKRTDWRPADAFPLPPEALRRLAADADPRMRLLAPRDPDLPTGLLLRLAADPEEPVREAVAAHPRLPGRALTRLLADPSERVAAAAAANPGLPRADVHRLLAAAGL